MAGLKAYVNWLAQRTGKPYRLLSEFEWEYAARSGSSAAYPFGEEKEHLCQHANGGDLSGAEVVPSMMITECRDDHAYTAPVGSFPPNVFGLYDMIGNVMEWVEDCFTTKHTRACQWTDHLGQRRTTAFVSTSLVAGPGMSITGACG